MNNEYSQERDRVNAKAGLICCSVFFMGLLIGGLFLAFYPNIVLCPYTDNSVLCTKTSCKNGYWGEKCLKCKECINGECIGSGSNTGTGLCSCNNGWEGGTCNNCAEGYWGDNCTKCDICIKGICNGSNTRSGNGKCICDEPFTGKNCIECLPNYYGPLCKNRCNNSFCFGGKCNNKINSENICKECYIGYKGELCNECKENYIKIGNKCLRNTNLTQICNLESHGLSITNDKFGNCKECPKNIYGEICSNNGKCIGRGTVFGSGNCNCNNNYIGTLCEFEGIKVNKSLCEKSCNKNGNCILYNNSYSCNCKNNFIGKLCNKCDIGYINKNNTCEKCKKGSGYWGKYCEKCTCENGYCSDGIVGNGTCSCNRGWTGPNCDICISGFYGKSCLKCINCNYGICNDGILGDGKCFCDKGYSGKTCNSCSKGFIKNNFFCQECPGSFGGKRENCYGNGKCIIKDNNAFCECNKGYKGKTCLEYESTNCKHLDYCSNNGICQNNNCFCNTDFFGNNCNLTSVNYMKMYNNTFLLSDNLDPIVKEDIETNKKPDNKGESIAASIAIVFSFLGCLVSAGFIVKNKNKIKRKFTQHTATPKIELTIEEKKYMGENPIFSLNDKSEKGVFFTKGLRLITKAVEFDNSHDYKDALENYNKGIDHFMIFLKLEKNSQTRFSMAKRLDIYLKRTQTLQRYINDKSIINILPEGPKPPIINSE